MALLGLGLAVVIAKVRRRERPPPVVTPGPQVTATVSADVAAPSREAGPEQAPELARATSADVLPERATWDVRTKARIERLTGRMRRRRGLLTLVVIVVLAAVLVVAVPALIRSRDIDRWHHCVERTTGVTLRSGTPIPRPVLDACGPRPGTRRVPADRRN